MKKYTIFKNDLNSFIKEINEAMTKAKIFYNVTTKAHKENDKIIVIIG